MTSPTVDQLQAALAHAGDLIADIRPEQWTARTPCEAWDVRELVSHRSTPTGRAWGHVLGRRERREDVVVATRVFGRMHDGPTGAGLSRAAWQFAKMQTAAPVDGWMPFAAGQARPFAARVGRLATQLVTASVTSVARGWRACRR